MTPRSNTPAKPPAKPAAKSPPVQVTYFQKPSDRARTAVEMPAPRITPSERRAKPAPAAGGHKGRRRTTEEIPIQAPRDTAKTEPEFRAVALQDGKPAGNGGAPMGQKQVAELALFGHHLFEKGKLAEARVVFEGLVQLGIKDAFPHTMLGIIYLSEGRADRALALFEEALSLDPDDVAARVYRGEIRLTRGRMKQALEDLGKVLAAVEPDDPFAERARKLMADAMGPPSKKGKRK